MATTDKKLAEAEELLGDGHAQMGFAKGLYFGKHAGKALPAYPDLLADEDANQLVQKVREFAETEIDPDRIDREADIPRSVIDGLGQLGVLGLAVPKAAGGKGGNQQTYCRIMEVLGGRCASTAVFVNAHHSIGCRALVLFGTPEQQTRWLPSLAAGEQLAAFALTEPQAGSDAGNVQTRAVPSPDGKGYILNGEKRYITNAAIAQVLTVMARTPVAGSSDTKVTAFLVTPDMPGFELTEPRMEKCGIRGTATGRLAFREMFVPKENILGPVGKGLKVALTVLDFGRTTFGASCTGAAKFCVERARDHARQRVQFGLPLGAFELVKDKLAYMAAGTFAMEAATYQTAALMDAGGDDYMLETAILKVFATDVLWKIVNDTIQLFGGKAYFCDEPFERMMRDARINTIGEGANDVLRSFVALVGLREVGLEFKGILEASQHPLRNFAQLTKFAGERMAGWFQTPAIPVRSPLLQPDAAELAHAIVHFAKNIERVLKTFRADFESAAFLKGKLQYVMGRVADAAIELYVSSCVLNRLDREQQTQHLTTEQRSRNLALGRYYLQSARRRINRSLHELWDHDDAATTKIADELLSDTSAIQ